MNSFETLSLKELEEIETNLHKQLQKIKDERKLRLKALETTSTSTIKISLKEKDKKEVKEKKVKVTNKSDDDKKPREIKATVASMKEVLRYHEISFASNAKKDELSQLLRENNLVREAEKKEANKE